MITTVAKLKPMNPGTADVKYTGIEPCWEQQSQYGDQVSRLTKAFSWYNYHYGRKEARDIITAYLEHQERKDDVKNFRKVGDNDVNLTAAWLCRMSMLGLVLTEQEQQQLQDRIDCMLKTTMNQAAVTQEPQTVVDKPNIQERLREKMIECAGEIEGMFDDFLLGGARITAEHKPVNLLRSKNVAPNLVAEIATLWQARLQEIVQVLGGQDDQLTEGWSNYSKAQLRSIEKFCESVINNCSAYVQIKKIETKPRRAKKVSPEQRARKFRCATEIEEFGVKGLPATGLVDCSEAWLYDVKKRKLIHVVADRHVGRFTIKNNMLIGISPADTLQKTLRKPAEIVKAIAAAGKPAARKIFAELTTTGTQFNGRGNEHVVILKTC
jgi:hypothetical protein